MKAVLFDLDGTLVDNMRFHFAAWKRIAANHGVALTDERIQRDFAGKKNSEIIPVLLGSGADVQGIAAAKEALYRELYTGHIALLAGAASYIARLKQAGTKVAIASAAPPENRALILGRTGVMFDAVVGGEEAKRGKPAPDIFVLAAERLGVAAYDCLVYEDAILGVQAAVAAGCRVTGVTTTESADTLRAAGAAATIRDFTEV